MALPKISTPTFEMIIPSTEQKVIYRPFLVKEEKILLMAMEGKDRKETARALKQIINNCCIDDIDVDKLAPFDLEYFFLLLRAKSIGETIDLTYACQQKKGKTDCTNVIKFIVDIDEIKVIKNPEHTNKIDLTDTVGIMMKYPALETIMGQELDDENVDAMLKIIIHCMEYIYDETDIHKMKDTDVAETQEFLEGLTQNQFIKIRKFFDTMPKVIYKKTIECDKCKKDNKIEIEGMQNFFG
jgi:hypothetical protein